MRDALSRRGASFFHEIVAATGLLPALVERGLAELAGAGIATADSFAGLRALLARQDKRRELVEAAGRWSLLAAPSPYPLPREGEPSAPSPYPLPREGEQSAPSPYPVPREGEQSAPSPLGEGWGEGPVEALARTLLKRYGVVFRSLLQRETNLAPWRDLVRAYRRLEARGEIRGGRFVAGFGGEQFAASDAVGRLRSVRKMEKIGELAVLSAADPLNLVGILTPEARVPAVHTNRLLLRDGLPIAALEGGEPRRLAPSEMSDEQLKGLLARRPLRQALQPHLRAPTGREAKALANRTLH